MNRRWHRAAPPALLMLLVALLTTLSAAAWPAPAAAVGALSATQPLKAAAATQPPPIIQTDQTTPTVPTAPGANDWERVKSAGAIVFGTAANYPPFEFYNSNFELDGFDIALARAIGKELGLEVTFRDYAFDGLLNAVELGNVDAAIAAISVTPDRLQQVDFTNLYYIGDTAVVAGSTFAGNVTSPTDLAGLKIGVERGTTFQSWAQQNLVDKGLIPQENLNVYDNANAILRDIGNGTIDVGLMGLLTAQAALQRTSALRLAGQGFYQQDYAIAVPNGSDLTAQLNAALLKLQANGTYAQLVKQFLQTDPNEVAPGTDAGTVVNEPITTTEAVTGTGTVTGTAEVTATVPPPPPCINSMAFVGDINLDDQNMTNPPVMAPGQDFTKVWRLRNDGTCPWAADYQLAYVNGNRIEASMGGTAVAIGKEVLPGETVDVSVDLRAPQVYGTFQGFWRMRDTGGNYFGETTWVGIQVPDPNPPPPPPPPPPGMQGPNLRADSTYISTGQCTAIRWDVDNVNAVYFVDGGNAEGVGGHDSRTVCPSSTATYVLRVVQTDNAQAEFPITINVTGSSEYTMNFWADRTDMNAGECTYLRWDVRNVQAVYLDGEGVAGVSEREVCPGSTKTYRLSAIKMDGGETSREVTINIHGAPPPPPQERPQVKRFRANTNQIKLGQCVNLEWRTDNARGVNLSRNGSLIMSGGSTNGGRQDCPDTLGHQEYRLEAYGDGGSDSQSLSVTVQNPLAK